jgi:hypothetical protein
MNFVESDDDGWPRMRPSNVDVRVIGSVFGAYHALKHRLDRALNEHGLDSSEGLVLAAIRLEPRCAPLDIPYTSRQERQGALDLFGACVAIDRPDRTIS